MNQCENKIMCDIWIAQALDLGRMIWYEKYHWEPTSLILIILE